MNMGSDGCGQSLTDHSAQYSMRPCKPANRPHLDPGSGRMLANISTLNCTTEFNRRKVTLLNSMVGWAATKLRVMTLRAAR